VTAGTGTLGLRVSSHPVARGLVESLGEPVTAPSANPSGLEHRRRRGRARLFRGQDRPHPGWRTDGGRRAFDGPRRDRGPAEGHPARCRPTANRWHIEWSHGRHPGRRKSVRMGGAESPDRAGWPVHRRARRRGARGCGRRRLIVTGTRSSTPFSAAHGRRVYPDHGSLGGIYSASRLPRATWHSRRLRHAVPSPRSRQVVVARAGQGDVVIPRVGSQLETMHAAYGKACLPHIEERLLAGQLRIVGFRPCACRRDPRDDVARFRDRRSPS